MKRSNAERQQAYRDRLKAVQIKLIIIEIERLQRKLSMLLKTKRS